MHTTGKPRTNPSTPPSVSQFTLLHFESLWIKVCQHESDTNDKKEKYSKERYTTGKPRTRTLTPLSVSQVTLSHFESLHLWRLQVCQGCVWERAMGSS